MQKQHRKAISALLVLAMVIGLFAAMPMTANAKTSNALKTQIEGFDPGGTIGLPLAAESFYNSWSGRWFLTVTGAVTGATNRLVLDIDAGVTVIWRANYAGTIDGSYMIEVSGGGKFEVAEGAIINRGNGYCIGSGLSDAVNVSGGTVATMGATAISSGGGAVNVSGGFLLACGMGNVEDVIRVQGGAPTIGGDAVVCAWKKPAGDSFPYVEGTSTNLKFNSGATAKWGRNYSECGINYAKNTNTGFFEISGVTFGDAVCQIGSELYPTLVSAIEDVPLYGASQTVIKLLRDITHPDRLYIGVKNITFDLNGFCLVIENTLELAQSTVQYTGAGNNPQAGFRVESKITDADPGSHGYAVLATKESSLVVTNVAITDTRTGINSRVTAIRADDKSNVLVEGNVGATNNGKSGAYACGVAARDASEVTVKGDITSSDCGASVGGRESTTVKVEGAIHANASQYVNVDEYSNAYRTAEEGDPAIFPGYFTYNYNGGSNTILVKKPDKGASTGDSSKAYTVTVNGGKGGGSYAEGATVKIAANAPATGKAFDKWTATGVTLTNPNNASTSFVMPGGNVTLTATYKDLPADKFAANVTKEGEKLAVTVTGKDAGLIVAVVMCRADAPYLKNIAEYRKEPDKYHLKPNDQGTGRFEFTVPEGEEDWELRYFVEDPKGELVCYYVSPLDKIKGMMMPKPEATIDYINERLTNLVNGEKYSFNGGTAETLSNPYKAITEVWFGTTVSIKRKGDGTTTIDSSAQSISIPARPAAPAVGKNDCTASQSNNGMITGVTSAMEYQKSGDAAWKPITGTTVTGLALGTYYVRFKAVDGMSFRSKNTEIKIASFVPLFAQNERYSFANAWANFNNKYNVSNDDFLRLCNYVKGIYDTSLANSIKNDLQNVRTSDWHGSCFGMAATAILDKRGQINMKNMVNPSAANLWQLPKPINDARIESAINYYQISQFIPAISDRFDVPYNNNSMTFSQRLERLVSNAKSGKIMQFNFGIDGWGGHSIVIIGYEQGANGIHNVIAYDVNYPNSDTIVTVSADYKTCYVEPYRNKGAVRPDINFTANFDMYDDIKIDASSLQLPPILMVIPQTTFIRFPIDQNMTIKNKEGQTLAYNAKAGEASGTMPILGRNMIVNATSDGEPAPATLVFTVPDSDAFTFETEGKGLDVSVVSPGIYAAASSEKANKATVTNGEGVTVSGNGAIDFKASLGLNSDVCDMVSLEGKANGEASLKYDGSGGAVAKGDFTKETTLTVFSNTVDIEETKFTSKSGEVLVTKEAGKVGVKDSSDNNTTAPQKNPFTDIKEKDWYYGDVMYAYGAGLINGKSATLFAPEDNLTYAEAVKLAACMHQLYTTGKVTLAVGSGAWYQSYVDYAKENKIIGKDYDWNAPASRAGYMEIFANALPEEALAAVNSVADNSIPDVPANHPQAGAIYKLYRAGILQGVDAAHSCKPDSKIRRCEVAAILTRMMDEGKRLEFTLK